MSEREYTITFQPFEEAQKARPWTMGATHRLEFVIEPPIEVHDPQVVDGYMSRPSLTAPDPPVEKARLTHSDEERTYGNLMVYAGSVKDKDHDNRRQAKGFIKEKFEAALNPLGETTLHFVFKKQEDTKQ